MVSGRTSSASASGVLRRFGQAAALRLLDPLRGVVVALEADGLGGDDGLAHDLQRRRPAGSCPAAHALAESPARTPRAPPPRPRSGTRSARRSTPPRTRRGTRTCCPVNAKGEVRLRSVWSRATSGSLRMPRLMRSRAAAARRSRPSRCASSTRVSWSPRNTEMIAGGASLAPRRWSLPELAMAARSRPARRCTARRVAVRKTRNCRLLCGVAPGSSRLLARRSRTATSCSACRCRSRPRTASRAAGRPGCGGARRGSSSP